MTVSFNDEGRGKLKVRRNVKKKSPHMKHVNGLLDYLEEQYDGLLEDKLMPSKPQSQLNVIFSNEK